MAAIGTIPSSTSDGADSLENGRSYVLAGKITKSRVFRALCYLDMIAIVTRSMGFAGHKMRVVLVGGGGHASDILGAFEAAARARGDRVTPIIGIVADVEVPPHRFAHRGVRQLGDVNDLKHIDATHYIVAVGFSRERKALNERVQNIGLEPATIVHPRADIPPDTPIGAGTVILTGVCMSPMARVGTHVYLSHGCLIGHDCVVQDFATVLPGASVSGDTVLGEACMIGANATVIEGCKIGAGATIGAGAVVLSDIKPNVTAVGVPARARKRE